MSKPIVITVKHQGVNPYIDLKDLGGLVLTPYGTNVYNVSGCARGDVWHILSTLMMFVLINWTPSTPTVVNVCLMVSIRCLYWELPAMRRPITRQIDAWTSFCNSMSFLSASVRKSATSTPRGHCIFLSVSLSRLRLFRLVDSCL